MVRCASQLNWTSYRPGPTTSYFTGSTWQSRWRDLMNLRQLAKGQDCQVRLHVCNRDNSTTVLAHYRHIGVSGAGLKSPDWCAAHACSSCHDAIDSRTNCGLTREQLRLAHLEGMVRTLYLLWHKGALK